MSPSQARSRSQLPCVASAPLLRLAAASLPICRRAASLSHGDDCGEWCSVCHTARQHGNCWLGAGHHGSRSERL
jgi:hypothetical protein